MVSGNCGKKHTGPEGATARHTSTATVRMDNKVASLSSLYFSKDFTPENNVIQNRY